MAVFFFFKQKTAYELRISDWSSDVCSSDLHRHRDAGAREQQPRDHAGGSAADDDDWIDAHSPLPLAGGAGGGPVPILQLQSPASGSPISTNHPATCPNAPVRGRSPRPPDRKSAVSGQGLSPRVDPGGRRIPNKKTPTHNHNPQPP